jgi:hypothetical protein
LSRKEIHAPAVIRTGVRRACLPKLAALPSAGTFSLNSQTFLAIQPVNQFVIDQPTFPTKLDIQTLITVMGTTAGDCPAVGCRDEPVHRAYSRTGLSNAEIQRQNRHAFG